MSADLPATNADPMKKAFTTNSQKYRALTFTRYKPARDLNYAAEATGTLPGAWTPLTNVFSAMMNTNGLAEALNLRDSLPATNRQRFFRLRQPCHETCQPQPSLRTTRKFRLKKKLKTASASLATVSGKQWLT